VLETARHAIADQDYGWAMELLTHAVRVDTSDTEARRLKADAMRQWGYEQKKMYWRNLALGDVGAGGRHRLQQVLQLRPTGFAQELPPAKVIDAMRFRLDADKAADTHLAVGFQFRDPQDACALEIRRGVAVPGPLLEPAHDHLPGCPCSRRVPAS
jgi:alkyl sulfatase BDS1-like metallo-beta-lactamase superfamily hydrolase